MIAQFTLTERDMKKSILLLFVIINSGCGISIANETKKDDDFARAGRAHKPQNIFDQEINLREEIKKESGLKTKDPFTQEEYDRIKKETNSRPDIAAWYLEEAEDTPGKLKDLFEAILNKDKNTDGYEFSKKYLRLENIVRNMSPEAEERYTEQKLRYFMNFIPDLNEYEVDEIVESKLSLLENSKEPMVQVVNFKTSTMRLNQEQLKYFKECSSNKVQKALDRIKAESFQSFLIGLNTNKLDINFVDMSSANSTVKVDIKFKKGSITRGELTKRHEMKNVKTNSLFFVHGPHVHSDPKHMYTARDITEKTELYISKAAGAGKSTSYTAGTLIIEEYETEIVPTTSHITISIPVDMDNVSQCAMAHETAEVDKDDFILDPVKEYPKCQIKLLI